MHFVALEIPGAWRIEPERLADARGFFARTFCARQFAARGLETALVQCSISYNHRKGTLRGMHYQAAPHAEAKLVRCTRGAVYDVIVDIRPESPTFRRWVGIELSADNRHMVYVPEGCAHGFLTLTDQAEVFYQMSAYYEPGAARGFRWDDPAIGIVWPGPVAVMSARDQALPEFGASVSCAGALGTELPEPHDERGSQ